MVQRVECDLCGITEERDAAITLGWVPSYFIAIDGIDTEIAAPVCVECTRKRLRYDGETETYLLVGPKEG
jgi:hypothetical protein